MNALGWIILVAWLCAVSGAIGWTVRGWRYEVAEYRAKEEAERVVFGPTQDDGDRELW